MYWEQSWRLLGIRRRADKCSLQPGQTTVSQPDSSEVAEVIRELSEPLAAILSNAQAGQRMGGATGLDAEMMEVLSDIAQDGRRAGELLRRLDTLLTGGHG